MSAPISPVEICNLSLDLLRHNSLITSIETPTTDEESLAARWYDAIRRSKLREFPWNFARKRATISLLSAAPAFGYDNAYKLPNDYLHYVFIGEDPINDPIKDFVIEGSSLLVNNDDASSLALCYIWDIQTVQKFDPIFTMLLVGELAVMFGNSLTGLNKSIKGVTEFRDRWEAKARAKNGQENPPKVVYESPLTRKRHSGRTHLSYDGQHLIS